MKFARWIGLFAAVGLLGLAAWGGFGLVKSWQELPKDSMPSTTVKRGDVTLSVVSTGALQGGNSKMMAAPMTGSPQLVITSLRRSGELVHEGDPVVEFDTTEENYKLREAEADLAEASEQVKQAQNESLAKEEELNYDLMKAQADVRIAELETRRNPLIAAITAQQNNLTLKDAKEKLARIERDYPQRKAAATASIAIQEAARKKAQLQAETAKQNIDKMTLKAPADGYINIERNTNINFYFTGMQFPLFQSGDQVRAGMAVAQIPDMKSWEVTAQMAETDRGHLEKGQVGEIKVVALPGKVFHGKVIDLGGTTGSPWERRFECKLSLDDPTPELRPGMSARLVVTTEVLKNVLWVPAQAVFERDSRNYVYVSQKGTFTSRDVKLVRKSESRVVVEGLKEGDEVALANPDQRESSKKKSGGSGAMKAMGK